MVDSGNLNKSCLFSSFWASLPLGERMLLSSECTEGTSNKGVVGPISEKGRIKVNFSNSFSLRYSRGQGARFWW